MTNLVVNNRIVAAGLQSTPFLTDAIAFGHLVNYRERGLKAVVRCSKHDWIAAVVTPDEETMIISAGGFNDEASALDAARAAVAALRAS